MMDEVDSCIRMKIDDQMSECSAFNSAGEGETCDVVIGGGGHVADSAGDKACDSQFGEINAAAAAAAAATTDEASPEEQKLEDGNAVNINLSEQGVTFSVQSTPTTPSPGIEKGEVAVNGDSKDDGQVDCCNGKEEKPQPPNLIPVNGDSTCDKQTAGSAPTLSNQSNQNIETSNGTTATTTPTTSPDSVVQASNGSISNGIVSNGHLPIVNTSTSIINNITGSNAVGSMKKEESIEPTPFHFLAGEKLKHKREKLVDGFLYLTNYRLHLQRLDESATTKSKSFQPNYPNTKTEQAIDIPLAVIDSIETRDINLLIVFTKFVHSFTLKFESNESAVLWYKRLNDRMSQSDDDVFCFKFYDSLNKKLTGGGAGGDEHSHNNDADKLGGSEQLAELLERNKADAQRQRSDLTLVEKEFERMDFDRNDWRICDLNKDFKFCNSYPRHFIVPREINDKELDCVGTFRYSRRIPVVVWRSRLNGCVIARSSQPVVGWLGWRNPQDEKLLQNILRICNDDTHDSYRQRAASVGKANGKVNGQTNGFRWNNGSAYDPASTPRQDEESEEEESGESKTRKLLILDARSYTAAIANRAIGGGCECAEYYANCDVQFMCLNNIHTIRKSFYALRFICEPSQIDNHGWLTMLDGTKWLHYLSSLLKAAGIVVDAISIQERPVLVHCSDGWDRTPQVIALAQLMLDSYYRTFEGFRSLIEVEFLQFGHKFADRCRSSTLNIDLNERCPVFLQFLDCVHQLVLQFPTEFEFNVHYLVKLAHHTYSCLFGTFQFNTFQERILQHVYEGTLSIWAYFEIERRKFENSSYFPSELRVLRPSNRVKDMIFWDDVYVPRSSSPSLSDWFELFIINNNNSRKNGSASESSTESSEEFRCQKQHCTISCKSISKGELNRSLSYEDLPSPQKKDVSLGDSSNNNSLALGYTRHLSDLYLFEKDEQPPSNTADSPSGPAIVTTATTVEGPVVIVPPTYDKAEDNHDFKKLYYDLLEVHEQYKRNNPLTVGQKELDDSRRTEPSGENNLMQQQQQQHSEAPTTANGTTSPTTNMNMCNGNHSQDGHDAEAVDGQLRSKSATEQC